MRDQIARIDVLLKQHRPAYEQQLQPGASADMLAAFEQALGLTLPSAFHELYQWHDGQSFDCYEAFQDNRVFMALDDARESHEILTELLDAGEFQRANWWSRHWVPFLYNGAGDYVCVDLAGTFTGQVGQIIEFWHDDAGRNVIAPSLEAWLADYAALLERTEWEYYAETGEEPFLDWESSMPGYPLRFTAG